MDKQQLLSLLVINPHKLEKGSLPRSSFNKTGGTIGASDHSSWKLDNYTETIAQTHCELINLANVFCLIDRSGDTFLNGAHYPLGKNATVSLKTGDTIKVGDYIIKVNILQQEKESDMYTSIEELLQLESNQILLSSEKVTHWVSGSEENVLLLKQESLDPLLFFNEDKSLEKESGINDIMPKDNLGLSSRTLLISDHSSTNIESITNIELVKSEENEHKNKERN